MLKPIAGSVKDPIPFNPGNFPNPVKVIDRFFSYANIPHALGERRC
jgi:hypothetical protein